MEAAAAHIPGETLHLEIREPAFHGNMALLPLPAVGRMLVCPDVVVDANSVTLPAANRLAAVAARIRAEPA